jgi:hypothetical protein
MKIPCLRGLAVAGISVVSPLATRAAVVLDAHYNPADTGHVAAVIAPPNYRVEVTG